MGSAALAAMLLVGGPIAAGAETMKQCSAKYQAAKTAGTLNGQDWKDFRKAQCGGGAVAATGQAAGTPAAVAAPAAPAAAAPATPATPAIPAGKPEAAKSGASSGPAVFPSAVSPKYASLSAGKGRMKTCLDQYHANKNGGGNGGMNWIQKGGGYYSQCSKHLKAK